MTVLKVRFLGGFELVFDGDPIRMIKTQKAKGLFAYLIMNPKVPLARERVAALFWPDQPIEKAAHSLRQALSTLRKGIPHFDTFCHVDRHQLMCQQIPQLEVDVFQFESACQARQETAVSLYKGAFLEGFHINHSVEYETWLLRQREQWRTQLLTLLEHLANDANQQNRSDDAKKYLTQLIDLDPWHESAYQNLMRLLATQGEFNRALVLFQTLKDRLQDGLAIEPMESSYKLLEKIQAARERQSNRQLPNLLSLFVGREAELQQLERLLMGENGRLITILGSGGVGKSSLALQLARRLEGQFLNGAFYVPLASLNDPHLIPREIATAVKFKAQHNQSFDQQLVTFLGNREMLLILDNFEHLLPGRQFVATLLKETNDISIVVTSREPLNLQPEHRIHLVGLPYPTHDKTTQNGTPYASFQLFVAQAQKINGAFQPEKYTEEILTICRLLEGMPLGVELAAAQIETQTVPEILRAISDNFNSLQKDWGDRPDRHHSLHAVFRHAWQQLTNPQQIILGGLSVFRGGFDLTAAREVAQATRQDLNQLLNKSLIHRTGQSATRYHLHPVVQQYAAEAVASSTLDSARLAHASTYLQLVQSFQENDGYGIENLESTMQQLELELDNVRQAWRTAVLQTNIPLLAPALISMSKLYAGQSWFREGADIFSWTVEQLAPHFADDHPNEDKIFWGHLNGFTAGLFLYLSEAQTAKAFAERSITILNPLPAMDELAYAWNMLGIARLYQGDFAAAIDALETSKQTYAKTNSFGQMLGPLINLGSVYQRIGEYEKGLNSLMEAYDISQKSNDRRGSAHLLNNIGGILFSMGRLKEATDYFERCNTLCEETGYPMVQASAHLNLAELQLKMNTGNDEKIKGHLESGLSLSQTIGDKQKIARAHKLYADYWIQKNAFEQAHHALQEGIKIVWQVKAMPTVFELLLGFATYFIKTKQTVMAQKILSVIVTYDGVPQHIQKQANSLIQEQELDLPEPLQLEELIRQI